MNNIVLLILLIIVCLWSIGDMFGFYGQLVEWLKGNSNATSKDSNNTEE